MTILCEASHLFESASSGTPPFVTSFHFNADDAPDLLDLTTFVGAVKDAWNDHLAPLLSGDLLPGQLVVTVPAAAGEFQLFETIDGGGGDGSTTPPGCSFRAIFTAPRPPKARNNGMYLPLASPAFYNADGTVHSDVTTGIAAWGTAIKDAEGASGIAWVARHQVGGPTSPVTTSAVSAASAAATVSFLRKRYR